MACFLIVLGIEILLLGPLWPYLSKLGLGRMPGDIVIERGNFDAAADPRRVAGMPIPSGCD